MRVVSGKEVHEEYNEAVKQSDEIRIKAKMAGIPLIIKSWEEIDEKSRTMYERMAESINKIMEGRSHV